MVSNDEHSQESEAPQDDETGSARIERMLREKGPAVTHRPNGDGQLAPDVPSLHLGTVAHEAKAEREDPEDGTSSKVVDESPDTEGRQQNKIRSDDRMELPDLQGDHQAALDDGIEEANNAKIAPVIDVENGRVNISRASPIEHEVADYGLVSGNDEMNPEANRLHAAKAMRSPLHRKRWPATTP